jgi:16S rRNA (uracil1498-N3)-methyltransferase
MDRHSLRAEVIESRCEARPAVHVIIAPSLTKSHAMNWMIEKLSEMGVDEIWPIIADRTDARSGAALLEKWEKIASQSLKVNRRLWRTEVRPPISPRELVVAAAGIPTKILLEIDGKSRLRPPVPFPAVAVIGPPGDFTAEERNRFREGGFAGCQINSAVLKTETAALAAAAILKND